MPDYTPTTRSTAPVHRTRESRVERSVGVSAVDATVLARSRLPRIDYVDHFVLTPVAGKDATAEQWARAMFGDSPTFAERFIWQCLLRLRLQTARSSTTVAGWRIGGRGADWVRLESDSRALSAELVVRTSEESLELITLLRYDRADGRLVWRPLSAVHRRLTPGVLHDAVEKVSAPGAT